MEERKHHPQSPSHYPAWTECPCWESDKRNSKDASVGSLVHEQAQAYIEKGIEPDNRTARWFGDRVIELASGAEIKCEVKVEAYDNDLGGIFGYVDAVFKDSFGITHIVDYKTFSDGTKNYRPQLEGYAALECAPDNAKSKVVFHILHGGIWSEECWESTFESCYNSTVSLLAMTNNNSNPRLCSWCSMCSKCKECKEVSNAVQVVNGNSVTFSGLSICQKLVVLDAVDKLSKSIREDAKKQAIENGGVLDMDGIRYEMRPRAGKGELRNILDVANTIPPEGMSGLTNKQLLALCDLPKTKFIEKMKEVNKENKGIKKKDIEEFCASFYDKGEAVDVFTRVK